MPTRLRKWFHQGSIKGIESNKIRSPRHPENKSFAETQRMRRKKMDFPDNMFKLSSSTNIQKWLYIYIYRILSVNDGSKSAIWLRTHACFALKLLAFAIRALPTSWAQHPCIPHLIATSGLELEAHAKRSNEPTRKPPPLSMTIRCLMGQDGQSGKHCLGRKFRGKKKPVQPPTSQILLQFCRAWRFRTGWD